MPNAKLLGSQDFTETKQVLLYFNGQTHVFQEVAQQCKQLSQASCRCEDHWLGVRREGVEEEEAFGVAPVSAL